MQPSVLNRRQFSVGIGATALAGFGVARAQSEGRIVLGDQFGREGEVEVVDGQRHGLRSIWVPDKQNRLSRRKADLS
jgi:hypothetical protein